MKSLLISVIAGSLVFGLTACGGGSGKSEDTKKDNGDKVVLDVINYHVGTDYAADYYEYLFEEFQKQKKEKMWNLILRKFRQQMHIIKNQAVNLKWRSSRYCI